MIITLRRHFSCAHFYRQAQWTDEQNRATFGKCFTEYGHGHDYSLEITVSSALHHIDESTVASFEKTVATVLNPLVEQLDHQHLNFVIPEFKSKIPTTENLALYIKDKLIAGLQNTKAEITLQQLRLFERPDLWVEL